MITTLLSLVAPHLCCGCNKIGTILCDYCKYNIINGIETSCILCGNKSNNNGVCEPCQHIVRRGWCVGERSGVLRKLIDDYKFENAKAAHQSLAMLLDDRIDELPASTVVVPVPTISSHIRQRGYDHAALMARAFARRRSIVYRPLLRRMATSVQRTASREKRLTQAKEAFAVNTPLSPNCPYLIVDDIVTTGATLTYAAQALRVAGATEIWVAAVARQPLD